MTRASDEERIWAPNGDRRATMLSRQYKIRFLAVMFLVATFNFADRAVFAATAQTIKQDLALTDLQLGMLQGLGFAIVYSVLGIPIGRLAERTNRIGIVAVSLAIWSVMTMYCGFAAGFSTLLIARAGVGIGEAGFMPPTVSLTSDHFVREKRASAMSVIMLGTPVGTLLGALAGGWIAQDSGWRQAFLVVGAPGIALAVLLFALLREPPRGLSDGASQRPETSVPPMRALFDVIRAKPSLLHIFIGGPLAGFGMTSIAQFMVPFFVRTFSLPVGRAASLYGIVSAASLALGLLIGSFGSDRAGKSDPRWSAWGPALGLVGAVPFYLLAFRQEHLFAAVSFLFAGGILLLFFYGPTIAMIQNLVGERMRASAAALYAMLYSLIGLSLGPTFVGFASDLFASADFTRGPFRTLCKGGIASHGAAPDLVAACQHATAQGLKNALTISTLIFIWAAVHYILAARTLRRDLAVTQPSINP